nr:murein biosynthesis integral membrane protein MurJ [Agaribacterium haliotis]
MLKSSAIVSSMTMLSRVLGLVRDILLARFIGAGGDADAFYVAFKVPNFLRRLFAEGAFSQAFVPVLSELRQNGTHAAVQHFVDRVAGCLGLSLLALTLLVVVASPGVAAIFGTGFIAKAEWDKFWLTSDLLKITFPYLFLISMTGFAGGILNSYDRFAVPALTPIFLNVALIAAAALVSPHLERPVYALAWGVFVAGVLQLSLQLPFLARLSLLPRPKVDWKDKQVVKVLKLMAPAMFGVSVSQINLTLDTILASFLVDGSISWLYFSDRLIELPLGVFAVGIATVILPNLSRQHSADDGRFGPTLEWAMQMVLLIAVPATLALVLLAKPLLFTLFQYNSMQAHDMNMAALSLQAYALGLCAFMLIKVLASAYYSRQDMKSPVRIGIIAMVANMFMNFAFVLPLLWLWNVGHVGLALATSGSAMLNAFLLYRGLKKAGVLTMGAHWPVFGARLLFAALAMAAALLLVLEQQSDYELLSWLQRSSQLALLVVVGLACYGAALFLSGMRPRHLRPLA